VLSTSSGRQLVVANGITTAQTIHQVRLQPLREGHLTIPPISVTLDGQVYSTDSIVVSAAQGAGQAQPAPAAGSSGWGQGALPPLFDPGVDPQDLFNQLDQWMQSQMPGLAQMPSSIVAPTTPIPAPEELTDQDYYVEATVDKAAPYQGEQVVYTLRLYRAINPFGQIEYQAPGFTGFWSKQQEGQKDFSTEAGGRGYVVSELKTVLFPAVAGQVTIDPATFTVPGDFFGPGTVVKSPPVTLDVKPLPADAPASFTGAVGRFALEAQGNKTQATVGDAISQRVTISGTGNLETLADPVWPDSPAWRAFDSQSETVTQFRNGQFGGTRTIDRVMVPTQAGKLSLPAIEFSFFDPALGRYETASTQPMIVAVAPAAHEADASVPSSAAQQPTAATASPPQALLPLKSALVLSTGGAASLPQRPGYWFLWSLPIALVLGQTVWQRRRRYRSLNAATLHSQKAAKQAYRALSAAQRSAGDAYATAGRVLVEFIGARLHRPVAGLTQRELADLLLARGVAQELVARVQAVLARSEVGRYAPAGATGAETDLLAETAQVIDELDRVLR
jgi:hypothetical protein